VSRLLTFLVCALAMAVFGLVLALPGAAFGVESVRLQLGLDVDTHARLLVILFGGFLIGTLVSGPLADHVGLRPILSGATLLIAVGLCVFAAATRIEPALGAALLLGIGGASINTCANTLISGNYPERRGAMLTWLAVACAAGGLTLPSIALTGGRGWTAMLVTAALVALVVSVAVLRVDAPAVAGGFSWRGLGEVVGARGFGWYLAALVCQGGNEAALAGWLTPHVTGRGVSSAVALIALTCHWGGILAGRLGMAVVVDHLGTRRTIVAGALVASLGTLLLIAARSPFALIAAATIAGVGISGVFSVVMADAGDRYSSPYVRAGTMFAALLAAGQIGGMAVPWLVGRLADRVDLDAGLLLVSATTLAVGAITLRNARAIVRSAGL
jgi:fucose permease